MVVHRNWLSAQKGSIFPTVAIFWVNVNCPWSSASVRHASLLRNADHSKSNTLHGLVDGCGSCSYFPRRYYNRLPFMEVITLRCSMVEGHGGDGEKGQRNRRLNTRLKLTQEGHVLVTSLIRDAMNKLRASS